MIALDFGLGGFEADIWRVVFLMTRVGAALLAAPFLILGGAALLQLVPLPPLGYEHQLD